MTFSYDIISRPFDRGLDGVSELKSVARRLIPVPFVTPVLESARGPKSVARRAVPAVQVVPAVFMVHWDEAAQPQCGPE